MRSAFKQTGFGRKLFICAEVIAICATCFGVVAWMMESDNRRQERNARAWAIVTTQAPGNSGKAEALEYLASQDIPLDGIDISCARMGGEWDQIELTCERQIYAEGLQLVGASLDSVNFSGTYLVNADFSNATLNYAKFEGASLLHTSFENASLTDARFNGAFIADADFSGAKDIPLADFTDSWTIEGSLPKGLAGIEVLVCPNMEWVLDETKPEDDCAPMIME